MEFDLTADQRDLDGEFDRATIAAMGKLGFFGIEFPPRLGGLGHDLNVGALAINVSLVGQILTTHGRPDVIEPWVEGMLRGEILQPTLRRIQSAGSLCSILRRDEVGHGPVVPVDQVREPRVHRALRYLEWSTPSRSARPSASPATGDLPRPVIAGSAAGDPGLRPGAPPQAAAITRGSAATGATRAARPFATGCGRA